MRIGVVRIVMSALVVTLIGATFAAPRAAQCFPAKLFASAGTGPFADNVRVDAGSAENVGNEIGRFWQSSNSHLGHNFDGECASNNGAAGWWRVNAAGLRRIEGFLSSFYPADDTFCEPASCPVGAMTVLVEDRSTDGEDALFIGFLVDEAPAEMRWWDYSRVDPSPSPSELQMLSFPRAEILSSSALPGGTSSWSWRFRTWRRTSTRSAD